MHRFGLGGAFAIGIAFAMLVGTGVIVVITALFDSA